MFMKSQTYIAADIANLPQTSVWQRLAYWHSWFLLSSQLVWTAQVWQIWNQSVSDWPEMGQIRDFFKSDFSTFGSQIGQIRDFLAKCTEI